MNRVGTFTIFFDNAPNGDFSTPDSFRDGMPVMTGLLRHQVVLNTTTNTFTTVFVITVTQVSPFRIGGQGFWFGQPGQKTRLIVSGQASTSGPGQFVIVGYATGGNNIVSQELRSAENTQAVKYANPEAAKAKPAAP